MRPGRTALLIVAIACGLVALVALGWRLTRTPSMYRFDDESGSAR